jgi:5-(carboxyamino)imidazole ribonucleotide mutase
MTSKPLVVIILGSKADLEHGTKIAEACRQYGLETSLRIASAHKTPDHALGILKEYESSGRPLVFITVAGRSNALSGFVDGAVSAPVIACPPPSEAFGGADLFSSVRMPSGIAPTLVLEPANAALLAAKIFAVMDVEVRAKVKAAQKRTAEKILEDDASVRS